MTLKSVMEAIFSKVATWLSLKPTGSISFTLHVKDGGIMKVEFSQKEAFTKL